MLATFFKHRDTRLGVFYPTHYLVAIMPSFADAEKAEREIRWSGVFEDEDVLAVPAEDVILHADEHMKSDGLLGVLMRPLSRMIGTEAVYEDQDLKLIGNGAALLAVYCPTEKKRQEAWERVQPWNPLVARYYAISGLEHLAGEL
jgi:hypothetical protein